MGTLYKRTHKFKTDRSYELDRIAYVRLTRNLTQGAVLAAVIDIRTSAIRLLEQLEFEVELDLGQRFEFCSRRLPAMPMLQANPEMVSSHRVHPQTNAETVQGHWVLP